jgi:hypothetical protein
MCVAVCMCVCRCVYPGQETFTRAKAVGIYANSPVKVKQEDLECYQGINHIARVQSVNKGLKTS